MDRGGFDFFSSRGRKLWGWGVYGVLGLCFTSPFFLVLCLAFFVPVDYHRKILHEYSFDLCLILSVIKKRLDKRAGQDISSLSKRGDTCLMSL